MISLSQLQADFHFSVPRDRVIQFLPTHVSRNAELVAQGALWITKGGCVDLTASNNARDAVEKYHSDALPLDRVTVSTDAYGSWPEYDSKGHLISYKVSFFGSEFKPVFILLFLEKNTAHSY